MTFPKTSVQLLCFPDPVKSILLLMVLFLNGTPTQAQQVWTRQKGEYYSQIGFTLYRYTALLKTYDELVQLDKQLVQNSIQGYFEYGIMDNLMVTAIVPFTLAKSTATSNAPPSGVTDGALSAFSNVQIGLTYALYKNRGFVFSAKLNAALPTATYQNSTGLRSGEDALALEPSALVGYSNATFFTSVEVGFAYRTNQYSSQTLGAFQIGKQLGPQKKVLLIFNTNLRLSNKNGSYDDKNSTFTAAYLNNLTYLAPGIKFGYRLTSLVTGWVNVRAALPPTQNIGANTQLIPGLSLAISYSPH